MINVSHAVHMPLPIWPTSQCTGQSLDPMPWRITGKILFFFQFKNQIHTHESNFHVTGFSYVSNTYCGEGLPQSSRLSCGRHCLQLDTGRHRLQVDTRCHCLQPDIQARVLALLPQLRARDTNLHHGHLHLEGKLRCGECLYGWHWRRIDLWSI
jgi:hypothetical protein